MVNQARSTVLAVESQTKALVAKVEMRKESFYLNQR
jgi:hypothetical protein